MSGIKIRARWDAWSLTGTGQLEYSQKGEDMTTPNEQDRMHTNKTIQSGELLDIAARNLIEAAHNYWEQYQHDLGPSAVVWLETDSGHFVLFTRSEYKNAITSAVTRDCISAKAMFDPFVKSQTKEG